METGLSQPPNTAARPQNPAREFHYRWEWQLKSSPEALWPLVSDTNRFNRDTNLPSVERRAAGARLENARRRLRLFRLGLSVEWEESPFEWMRPYRFGVVRRYTSGPVAEMRVRVELTPQPGGGTHLVYEVWARPSNPLGLIAIPIQIGLISARDFDRAFRAYDRIANSGAASLALGARSQLAPGGQARLSALREELVRLGENKALVAQLADLIQRGDEIALARLRPYAYADVWGVPRRDVLELFLRAVRVGLLEYRWDVLCPLCRGARETSPSLYDLKTQVHCDTCNIDYTANFERSVELTFRPAPLIREISDIEYCVGGPQLTPHIVAQQLLAPGETRRLMPPLQAGRYRLRALELKGGQSVMASEEAQLGSLTVTARPEGWPDDEPHIQLQSVLQLENKTGREQLLILERTAWNDQAVMAAEVTTLQLFRDLFAAEALRPGERISVGSLTIVFTDLQNSSRLYQEVGDAVAFGWVMAHYDILRENIVAENGAIVKTIGDSVMAVFVHPLHAVRAILRAQHELAHPPEGRTPLKLKAGLHYGPCIAVRLNDRLDYFGTVVNFAARLSTLSAANGIVISAAVRNDPEVSEYLRQTEGLVQTERVTAQVKGFSETFEVWRVGLD